MLVYNCHLVLSCACRAVRQEKRCKKLLPSAAWHSRPVFASLPFSTSLRSQPAATITKYRRMASRLPAELVLAIYANMFDLRTASNFAATSCHSYSIWAQHRYQLNYDIRQKDAFAWVAALDLAELQQQLEDERGEPLPEDFKLRTAVAPRFLTPHQRKIYANREYAESACRVFLENWEGARHRGPSRYETELLPHEKELFTKAFYKTVAFVTVNYRTASTDHWHSQLIDPVMTRLDLSLLNIWKIVEIAELLQCHRSCVRASLPYRSSSRLVVKRDADRSQSNSFPTRMLMPAVSIAQAWIPGSHAGWTAFRPLGSQHSRLSGRPIMIGGRRQGLRGAILDGIRLFWTSGFPGLMISGSRK